MGSTTAMADAGDDLSNEFYQGPSQGLNAPSRPRYPGIYVGNLTWWTTDEDVTNAIQVIGVNDIQEVKFFENRNNGQSKGFCVVTFQSEHSLQIVMDKLPKLELYGQNPMVAHYNRQNLSLFETQPKVRPPINSNNGPNSHGPGIMGINSTSGLHAPGAPGLPFAPGGNFSQGMGIGGPRNPGGFHGNMRMRGPKPDLYSQNPVGGPYRQNMNMFDPQSKMRPQLNSNGPHGGAMMGINSLGNSHMSDGGGGGGGPPTSQSYQAMNPGGYNHGGGGPGVGLGRNPSYNPNMRGHPNMRGGIGQRPGPRREDDHSSSSSRRLDDHSSSRRDDEPASSSRHRDEKPPSTSRREEKSSSLSSRHRDEKTGTSSSSSRRERGSHRDERVRSRSRERSSERHHRGHRSRERSGERTRERSRDRRERREKRDSRH